MGVCVCVFVCACVCVYVCVRAGVVDVWMNDVCGRWMYGRLNKRMHGRMKVLGSRYVWIDERVDCGRRMFERTGGRPVSECVDV